MGLRTWGQDPAISDVIHRLHSGLLNKLLKILLSLGTVTVLLIFITAWRFGFHLFHGVVLLSYMLIAGLILWYRRSPNPWIVQTILGISALYAMVGLASFGLASTAFLILTAVITLTGLFFGPHLAFRLLAVNAVIILSAGFAYYRGWVSPVFDLNAYVRSPFPWLAYTTIFVLVAVSIVMAIHAIQIRLSESLVSLQLRANELVDKEEKYRLLAENMQDVLFMQDMNMNIVFINSAVQSVFGYTPEEVKTLKMQDYLAPDSLELVMRSFQENLLPALRGVEVKVPLMELQYIRKDGSYCWGELRVSFVRDSRGVIIGSQGIIRDVSERKQAEAALIAAREAAEEASRTKSNFIAMMSHELRTPLTSILGFSELLSDHSESDLSEENKRICERLNRNSRHLLNLINNILDLAAIESGKIGVLAENIDLRLLVEESTAMMSSLVGRKPVEIRLEIAPNLPRVETDGVKLMQVYINILGNAIKFTEKGQISVTVDNTHQCPDHITIRVADTGIGIPPEKLQSIFEKFEQASAGLARRFGGAGLGLSISRSLMEMLKGTIQVESEVGRGSTFSVVFPVRYSDEQHFLK